MGIKCNDVLDERYRLACIKCLERHTLIYGVSPYTCMFRHVDDEYCPDIETAERMKENKKVSEKKCF